MPAATTPSRQGPVARLVDAVGAWLISEDLVRCEHDVTFLGLRVLTLHYRISPVRA
jgi:hypothetical protein